MSRGSVFIFDAQRDPPPALGRYWKIPDHTADIDVQGRFTISLPVGSYYIAAIRRHTSERLGPPVASDYFYASREANGRYRKYTVKKDRVTSVGTIKGIAPAKESDIAYHRDITGIAGMVSDKLGKPVEKALVLAYDNPAMQGPPLFTSSRTGSDGIYLLGVQPSGVYYLKVRDVYGGGKPQTGGILGAFGTMEEPGAVTVKDKKITRGIDISVERFSGSGQR
jgi:hypothetical protein